LQYRSWDSDYFDYGGVIVKCQGQFTQTQVVNGIKPDLADAVSGRYLLFRRIVSRTVPPRLVDVPSSSSSLMGAKE
jgi:hypothetical protein